MSIKLSILICSLEERADKLARLLAALEPQRTAEIEVLTDVDNRQKPIGTKRNQLVQRATGDYTCFVDDDDLVAEDYVQQILTATAGGPDCCGLEGIITFAGKSPRRFVHSITCAGWYERDGVYYRTPNHLNPVKREYALLAPFPDTNHGEDKCFSDGIRKYLNVERYICKPIYYYQFAGRLSEPRRRAATVPGATTAPRKIVIRPSPRPTPPWIRR